MLEPIRPSPIIPRRIVASVVMARSFRVAVADVLAQCGVRGRRAGKPRCVAPITYRKRYVNSAIWG